ncbi:MAG: citrate synthase [Actinomycetota bacterium]|nr:citrate synthase [Actinomycetota bacterium]
MDDDQVLLSYDGGEEGLPRVSGAAGESAIDISRLLDDTGMITLDYGFANTASCESGITHIDGRQGVLRYRGYPIQQLAEQSSFLEVTYLLNYGELPTSEEIAGFEERITQHTLLNEEMKRLFDAFPKDTPPMAILSSATQALSAFYPDYLDPRDPQAVEEGAIRLIAKLPTIAAFAYKKSVGQPYVYPRNDLYYTDNFLQMFFSVPTEPYQIDPLVAKALDVLFILHADHGQNLSTSTVRFVGSGLADLFASIAAGINGLSGPLHGGANVQVVEMLQRIHDDPSGLQKYLAKAKDRHDSFRLMGFGHRVYRNFDPRANFIKEIADEILDKLGREDPLLDIALELEAAALSDDYFVERKLYPNVDFYSGIIYRAIGFPARSFPVLFAIGRLPGWIAQWREMMADPETRIGRPRQLYVGPKARDYVPVDQR